MYVQGGMISGESTVTLTDHGYSLASPLHRMPTVRPNTFDPHLTLYRLPTPCSKSPAYHSLSSYSPTARYTMWRTPFLLFQIKSLLDVGGVELT